MKVSQNSLFEIATGAGKALVKGFAVASTWRNAAVDGFVDVCGRIVAFFDSLEPPLAEMPETDSPRNDR